MENLTQKTPIELQKLAKSIKAEHEELKNEITKHTYEIESLEKIINDKINKISDLEHIYVSIISELDKR